MSEKTTISVRLDSKKKDRLDGILQSIGLSRQKALEKGVEHIIERFEILADVDSDQLESKIENLTRELYEEGVIESEINIEAIPVCHKALILSSFLNWLSESHKEKINSIHRKHREKYPRTPELRQLMPDPFDVQDLKSGKITEDVEVPADELYHHPDRVTFSAKVRHTLLILEEMFEEVGVEGFREATKQNYGEDIQAVRLEDSEISIRKTQDQDNRMEVQVDLPFEPVEN